MKLFDEDIDFSLEAGVPDPLPFEEKLRSMLEDHDPFIESHQHAIGNSIMEMVGQFSMIEGSANRLEQEQEREQEQEQEKEVEARKDQQIEVEKFVDREYSRQEEVQKPWPFKILAESFDSPADHPFYYLKNFKLRHQEPLEFANNLMLSTNYFNPNWTGLRRVKNVVMVMEYAPSTVQLRPRLMEETRVSLNESQENALRKAHTLLGFHAAAAGHVNMLCKEDLRLAVQNVIDKPPSEELLDSLISKYCSSQKMMTYENFRDLLTSGELFPETNGRYFVALSLAEAETIRKILHVRSAVNSSADTSMSHTELALRYSPIASQGSSSAGDGGLIFDVSKGWKHGTGATSYEAAVAHSSFRFFDGDMHFSITALNILVRCLKGSIRDREKFFLAITGVRRRMERRWQETPLAKVFLVTDQWVALRNRAQATYFAESLKARDLSFWEAYTAIDYDNNGVLSPAEFYGALIWLNFPNITADDAADFLEAIDSNRDGNVDYKEYMEMLNPPLDFTFGEEATGHEGPDSSESEQMEMRNILKIEPYGGDEIREVIIRRKQLEITRIREERLRRQAYADALDVKVFEEELEASKLRKGGANPSIQNEGIVRTQLTQFIFLQLFVCSLLHIILM